MTPPMQLATAKGGQRPRPAASLRARGRAHLLRFPMRRKESAQSAACQWTIITITCAAGTSSTRNVLSPDTTSASREDCLELVPFVVIFMSLRQDSIGSADALLIKPPC